MKNKINEIIVKAIENYDGSYQLDNSFEELISFGEIVDRLSIVNFKLFVLKDEVMKRPDDKKFKAWASVEDVKLVKERSRLKKCIDEKLLAIIKRVITGDETGGFNPEVKKYGDKYEK
jgi:hypothetical protein